MFPKRMWVLPTVALALALVLTSVFASAVQAQGGTPSGEYCIKGSVITWQEKPFGGLVVTVINPAGTVFQDTTNDDNTSDDWGTFEFKVGDTYDPNNDVFIAMPGIYTASVEVPDGWEGVTPTEFQFEIESGRNDCVRIRFKLRQVVPVEVIKIDSDHNLLDGWTIDAVPAANNLFAEPQSATTVSGTVTFTLTPGSWIFSERQPQPVNAQGYDAPPSQADRYQPVLPPGGSTQLDVQPLGPEDPPYVVVFKNQFLDNGCVVVRKFGIVPENGGEEPTTASVSAQQLGSAYGAAGWGFQLQMTDGTVFAQGVTDAEGYLVFRNLPYGPYTVVEEDRPGWDEITERYMDVTVTDGTCVPVAFENEQDDSGFCIEGYKLDANGLYGIPNWTIKVTSVHEGGWDVEDESDFYLDDPYYDEDNKFLTDGVGKYKIRFPDNDYRIPGQQFEVCEDEDVDGWLPHTPICQTITMPKHPGACVKAEDFINQQVGHSESLKKDEHGGKGGWQGVPGGGHPGAECKSTYVVKPGETLFSIGASFNVSPQAMVDANPSVRSNPDFWVYVGQTLCIP